MSRQDNNVTYTSVNDAYNIQHVNTNTYSGKIIYDTKCIYCSNLESKSLMNDGGSFRNCNRCKKNFRSNILTESVTNYSYSTHHLNGTN
jgi:hypothetical protein